MKTSILWFRRDLRTHDNAALDWVCDNSEAVIPVYIHATEEEMPWAPGAASRWWLHHSLIALSRQLAANGLKLQFFSGSSEDVMQKIIAETGADSLVFNRLYEPHLSERDQAIESRLQDKVDVVSFDSGLFFSPGKILNNQQLPYRVFTPFYKKIRPQLSTACPANAESTSPLATLKSVKLSSGQTLESLDLLDDYPWHEKLGSHWHPGEDNAYDLLDTFIDEPVEHYDIERDIPAADTTSRLSPYLHFGEITPQQIYFSLLPLLEGERGAAAAKSAEVFLKQLVWREFAHNVLWHFPETATRPMNPRYQASFWRSDKVDFDAWTKGETGIAIVDAGMKQLWQTGWMHNRVRMIVSSFLTKNLGIHWLDGANWFWDTLVDADLANNSMGWQWVAGCGVDAAPYYRVFNPDTQTRRFDSQLRYIDTWAPGHAELDYPHPMVDLAVSRNDAIQRYKRYITSQESP
jgi:deoxyribodipyrimidine photo-lyase